MTCSSTSFLPDHHLLNQHRKLLQRQPDLTDIASPEAQRMMFTSILDYLATLPPFVVMDSLVDEDLATIIDTVLDSEPRDLDATPLYLLEWLGAPDGVAERRYSLRLVQFLGCLIDRYGRRGNPAHVIGALHELVPLLPEPSVLDVALEGTIQPLGARPSPPRLDRGRLHRSRTLPLIEPRRRDQALSAGR